MNQGPSSNCPATGDHWSYQIHLICPHSSNWSLCKNSASFHLGFTFSWFFLSCHRVYCKILCVLLYTLQVPTAYQVVSFVSLRKSIKEENWLEERNLIISADKCPSYLKRKKKVFLVTAIQLKLPNLVLPLTHALSLEHQTHKTNDQNSIFLTLQNHWHLSNYLLLSSPSL